MSHGIGGYLISESGGRTAKRGRNNKRQQRRETIRARSQQAQLNERLRDYSTGRIPDINDRNLGRLTVRQLEQVAGRVAQKVEEQQEALRARDARIFQATPDVTITKLDRELANRPLITDEQSKRVRRLSVRNSITPLTCNSTLWVNCVTSNQEESHRLKCWAAVSYMKRPKTI